jgi:hypothetical protein
MSLYRLDREDGTAVRDAVIGGDYLTRVPTLARQRARAEAAACGQAVHVTRIHGAGQMKHHYTATPGG